MYRYHISIYMIYRRHIDINTNIYNITFLTIEGYLRKFFTLYMHKTIIFPSSKTNNFAL